jgi:hypothetical protein
MVACTFGAGNWEANSETAFKDSISNGIRKEVVFFIFEGPHAWSTFQATSVFSLNSDMEERVSNEIS